MIRSRSRRSNRRRLRLRLRFRLRFRLRLVAGVAQAQVEAGCSRRCSCAGGGCSCPGASPAAGRRRPFASRDASSAGAVQLQQQMLAQRFPVFAPPVSPAYASCPVIRGHEVPRWPDEPRNPFGQPALGDVAHREEGRGGLEQWPNGPRHRRKLAAKGQLAMESAFDENVRLRTGGRLAIALVEEFIVRRQLVAASSGVPTAGSSCARKSRREPRITRSGPT